MSFSRSSKAQGDTIREVQKVIGFPPGTEQLDVTATWIDINPSAYWKKTNTYNNGYTLQHVKLIFDVNNLKCNTTIGTTTTMSRLGNDLYKAQRKNGTTPKE